MLINMRFNAIGNRPPQVANFHPRHFEPPKQRDRVDLFANALRSNIPNMPGIKVERPFKI